MHVKPEQQRHKNVRVCAPGPRFWVYARVSFLIPGVWSSLLCCSFHVTFLWLALCYPCSGKLPVIGYWRLSERWSQLLFFVPSLNPWNSDSRKVLFWLMRSSLQWCICGQVMSLSDMHVIMFGHPMFSSFFPLKKKKNLNGCDFQVFTQNVEIQLQLLWVLYSLSLR